MVEPALEDVDPLVPPEWDEERLEWRRACELWLLVEPPDMEPLDMAPLDMDEPVPPLDDPPMPPVPPPAPPIEPPPAPPD